MSGKRLIWTAVGVLVVGAAILAAAALGRAATTRAPGATALGTPARALRTAAAVAPNASLSATPAAEISAAQMMSSGGALLGRAPSTGANRTGHGSKPLHVSYPTTPAKPVKPKPTGPVIKDRVTVPAAIAFLPLKDFRAPQTYAAAIVPVGWKDEASGVLVARVTSASLTGAVNAATGQPMASPPGGASDHGKELVGIDIVASTNSTVRSYLTNQQSYKVYLVLLPSRAGAVFIVDRLR